MRTWHGVSLECTILVPVDEPTIHPRLGEKVGQGFKIPGSKQSLRFSGGPLFTALGCRLHEQLPEIHVLLRARPHHQLSLCTSIHLVNTTTSLLAASSNCLNHIHDFWGVLESSFYLVVQALFAGCQRGNAESTTNFVLCDTNTSALPSLIFAVLRLVYILLVVSFRKLSISKQKTRSISQYTFNASSAIRWTSRAICQKGKLPALILCCKSWAVSLVCGSTRKFTNIHAGGSFGVVYKAIENATGEVVAIKHVSASHQK